MRYIDTKSQLTDIFTKPLDSSHFAALQGGLIFVILMAWFGGGGALFCIFVSFAFLLHFLHTDLSDFASPVILACICLIMLITVLG
jgi:hypothetical protein